MRKQLVGGVALSAMLWSGVALAQPQASEPASGQQGAADAPPAPEQDMQGITDIVVTAQRRSESLQRAAIAATAVTGNALVNAGVSDPSQLTKLIPALTVQPVGISSSFFIRGVGATAINSFQENAVAFSVGGVFYARPTAPAATFYDLDRVEVLKGPQGTLYGRNATGGAINVIPRLPKLNSFGADLTAEYGNFDSKKVQGGINLPLGQTVAIRVAGQVVDRDGYLSDGYNDEKSQAVRASILFQPSSDFSMLLAADYAHQGGKGVGGVLFASPVTPNVPSPGQRVGAADPTITAQLQQVTFNQFSFIPPFSSLPPATIRNVVTVPAQNGYQRSDFYGTSLTTNGDMGFADLTTILAYRKSKPDILTYAPGFPGRLVEDDDQMSAEIRLSSKDTGPLRYVLGAFYFWEKQNGYNNYNQGLLANTEYYPRLETTSKAVFGQLTYALADGFRLVGGGRYTKEDKSLTGTTRNTSFFIPNPPSVPINGDLSFDKFTWKGGFEWDAGPRSLVYGNVSTGFKAGGFYPSAGANTYKPETLTAYTLGSKNRFFENKLQLNLEAFYWRYRDQQISYVGPIEATPGNFAQAGVTVNAGKARMYGAEAELVFQPTQRDTFGATVQYLNARYQSLVYNGISTSGAPLVTSCTVANDARRPTPPTRLFVVDCSGKPGVYSPKWTANVSYEHRFALGGKYELIAGARSRLETSAWLNLDYLSYQKRGGYSTSDAYLTLTAPDGRWSITGFVNNVEDNVVKAGGLTRPIVNTTILTVTPPRTYGVRVGVHY
ncbi:TonB-dependent receptor [Sphingomonas sp. BIUV-7]|uniref:TonB-dependent receptor n=1 Tax=Sphingomonas natans TaxID=3063330 RepID=A0ABT8YAG0_9SPHN|nr:TonB-dependent receptor [Sphingomonas sp. BIUV-7]MDO6415323.1 TonB-dependent receptor [Sphingomonas sp. BIUV-7]